MLYCYFFFPVVTFPSILYVKKMKAMTRYFYLTCWFKLITTKFYIEVE